MPPSPTTNPRLLLPGPVIVKSTGVLNVTDLALKVDGDEPKLRVELGRVLPANTRSVVVRLDTNGEEEKLSDVNVVASVNQLLDVPDPVHV